MNAIKISSGERESNDLGHLIAAIRARLQRSQEH